MLFLPSPSGFSWTVLLPTWIALPNPSLPPAGFPALSQTVLSQRYQTTHSQQADLDAATPMMRQYLEVKHQYPDTLLLYRMGDFYETFLEDAQTLARALDITLTGRDAGKLGKVPMAGIPVKAADAYLPRLLNQGFKLAICEQTEDPAQAKGLVRREVVRVLTPGTLTEADQLKADEPNYLAAIWLPPPQKQNTPNGCALAYCDLSTGQFETTALSYTALLAHLDALRPAELLVPGNRQRHPETGLSQWRPNVPPELCNHYNCTPLDPLHFTPSQTQAALLRRWQLQTLDSLGLNDPPHLSLACGAIVQYLETNFLTHAPTLRPPTILRLDDTVYLSPSARRHLELLTTIRDGQKEGTLYWALNRTVTAMGARCLRAWLATPSRNLPLLNQRLDAVETLVNQPTLLSQVRQHLNGLYDLERLATKAANTALQPRDLLALGQTLCRLPALAQTLQTSSTPFPPLLHPLAHPTQPLLQLGQSILQSLLDSPPPTATEGQIFQDTVHPDIAHLRQRLATQHQWLQHYETSERETTGLRSLKIIQNGTSGYLLELGKAAARQAPPHYTRKQTLTNTERFTTDALRTFETELSDAQTQLQQLEYSLFQNWRQQITQHAPALQSLAQLLATLDTLQSLATVASQYQYTRPLLHTTPTLHLVEARHPVLEQKLPMGQYVPNTCHLRSRLAPLHHLQHQPTPQLQLITGPNMAGKSTYMRQVALCVLMAQIGSFVPATQAEIGLVDAIFTRIGAVDDLAEGQSTFMVEMTETAHILHHATPHSLVLLDEIGRGTSTTDGVAIAWAIITHLLNTTGCRGLFATHYHELNILQLAHPTTLQNVRVCVSETHNTIQFLHRVEPGTAQRSYGIHVARMAGLPPSVIAQADQKLAQLQQHTDQHLHQHRARLANRPDDDPQLRLF